MMVYTFSDDCTIYAIKDAKRAWKVYYSYCRYIMRTKIGYFPELKKANFEEIKEEWEEEFNRGLQTDFDFAL